jgi:hypothetical protein
MLREYLQAQHERNEVIIAHNAGGHDYQQKVLGEQAFVEALIQYIDNDLPGMLLTKEVKHVEQKS